MNKKLKPFVKWAGGKTQLLDKLSQYQPSTFKHYFEPFVGGGAFFLYLQPKEATISDTNKDLIDVWKVIQNNHDDLATELKTWTKVKIDQVVFNKIRIAYNNLLHQEKKNAGENIRKAALFIVLNKICFNGLYRTNLKGSFNASWNQRQTFSYDFANLKNIHLYLANNNINIDWTDYQKVFANVCQNDFVYLDPPYDDTYKRYTKKRFNKNSQKELSNGFKELHQRKVLVMLSNSNTKYINELYQDFNLHCWAVNHKMGIYKKKDIADQEVLITNFD